MVFKKATPEETEAWLGSGVVIFGFRPADTLPTTEANAKPGKSAKPSSRGKQVASITGQEMHDRNLAAMSDDERREMVRKLADLARSKLGMDSEIDKRDS